MEGPNDCCGKKDGTVQQDKVSSHPTSNGTVNTLLDLNVFNSVQPLLHPQAIQANHNNGNYRRKATQIRETPISVVEQDEWEEEHRHSLYNTKFDRPISRTIHAQTAHRHSSRSVSCSSSSSADDNHNEHVRVQRLARRNVTIKLRGRFTSGRADCEEELCCVLRVARKGEAAQHVRGSRVPYFGSRGGVIVQDRGWSRCTSSVGEQFDKLSSFSSIRAGAYVGLTPAGQSSTRPPIPATPPAADDFDNGCYLRSTATSSSLSPRQQPRLREDPGSRPASQLACLKSCLDCFTVAAVFWDTVSGHTTRDSGIPHTMLRDSR